jgi:succinate dehydrogenase/fumarate reductase flavoprotein subunit
MSTERGVTRRGFLQGSAAVGAGAVLLNGLGVTEAGATAPPRKWNKEVDVVVVGFGGSGAAAAITVKDAGGKALILEKMPYGGGNSAVSSGAMAIPNDVAKGITYMKAQTFGTVDDDELIKTFVEALIALPDWFRSLGADIKLNPPLPGLPSSYFPKLPGSDSIQGRWMINPGQTGEALFKFMSGQVAKRGIEVLYETPAKRLVQDPVTREIRGVIAKTNQGDLAIKARKGVILCCGGYENNPEMKTYFNYPGLTVFPVGTPGNTGDGIKMVSEVGAQLWHNSCFEWRSPGIMAASKKVGTAVMAALNSKKPFIFVNKAGKRFQNESKGMTHTHDTLPVTSFSHDMPGYPNLPFFLVFDETMRKAGPIVELGSGTGYADVHKLYDWSTDNQMEIDKGWIVKGDTIHELAGKLGIDAAGLEDTLNKYTKYCEAGADPELGRSKRALLPLKTPPYYATELCLVMINTMGGPKHNAKAQVLDYANQPVPRLYAAGELGSIFGAIYQGGQNLPEAYSFGRIAGKNAVATKPWK